MLARLPLVLLVALIALTACIKDLTPQGGWSGIAPDGDYVYIGSKDGRIVRADPNTFTLDRTWVYPAADDDDMGEVYATPVISDGVVYGSAFKCRGNQCDGQVFAVNIDSGRSAWATGNLKIDTRLVGGVALGDTTLVFGTAAIGDEEKPAGHIIGLDFTSDVDFQASNQIPNREKWRIAVDGAVWGGVQVVDNVAYFGTLQGTLYAVDLADSDEFKANPASRVIWTFDAGGAVSGTPHVTDTNLYVGTFGNEVLALDLSYRRQNPLTAALGPSEWRFDTGRWIWAEPVLANGVLYVANLPGNVFALNASDGSEVWPEPAQVDNEMVGQPLIFESNRGPALALPSGEGDISVVLLSSGDVIGKFDTDGRGIKSSPVIVDDTLLVHTDAGQLRQYQPSSLSLLNCIEAHGEGKGC